MPFKILDLLVSDGRLQRVELGSEGAVMGKDKFPKFMKPQWLHEQHTVYLLPYLVGGRDVPEQGCGNRDLKAAQTLALVQPAV